MASTSSTLNVLALVAEHALGLVARPDFLGEGFVARDDLAHLLLDRGEIFRRERLVAEEVVIEAVLDHGPDRDLRAGPQRLHGLGEHMRAVVPDEFQRARVFAGEELDLGVMLDRIGEIGDRAIERHRDRALGERGRNAFGDIEAGDAVRDSPGVRRRERSARPSSRLLLTLCLRMQVSVVWCRQVKAHPSRVGNASGLGPVWPIPACGHRIISGGIARQWPNLLPSGVPFSCHVSNSTLDQNCRFN